VVRHLSILLCIAVVLPACSLSRGVLRARSIESVPKPNRLIERKSIWGKTKPLRVRLNPPPTTPGTSALSEGIDVTLYAIHDGRAISFLAVWPDSTGSIERRRWVFDPETRQYNANVSPIEALERRSWVWNDKTRQYFMLETPTDFFAFKFCISGSPRACMMTGEEGVYDVWQWRAGWSHISGFADDRRLIISRERPQAGEFRSYPTKGLVHLQWIEDRGDLPLSTVARPTAFKRNTMAAIQASKPTGSAGDVLAEAIHEDYAWWLEVWRLLDTGHEDDYQFKGRGPHPFSIALTDGTEGQQHFTSDLINLYLD
jgi:hypothetical protein